MTTQNSDATATIINIERCSSEDGKGIRTVVFFKGCNLKCRWCANPESQSFSHELLYLLNPCVNCGKCEANCPTKAITYSAEFGYITDMSRCIRCGRCIDNCYVNARVMMGKKVTTNSLLNELLCDKKYFDMSGGGITFSGGEPLIYSGFIRDISVKLKEHNISTLIETCGFVKQQNFDEILDVTDTIFYDIKHINTDNHKKLTGVGNELILENLRFLCNNYNGELVVRYPVIPDCNDNDDDITQFLNLIESLEKINEVWFLPYHRLGITKYYGLGRRYEMNDTKALTVGDLAYLKQKEQKYSFSIIIK